MFDPIFIRSKSITCNLLKSKISNYIYRIIYIISEFSGDSESCKRLDRHTIPQRRNDTYLVGNGKVFNLSLNCAQLL